MKWTLGQPFLLFYPLSNWGCLYQLMFTSSTEGLLGFTNTEQRYAKAKILTQQLDLTWAQRVPADSEGSQPSHPSPCTCVRVPHHVPSAVPIVADHCFQLQELVASWRR